MAMRSAMLKARSRSWVTTMDVAWVRFLQLQDFLGHRHRHQRVQFAGRFVKQNQLRVHDQGAGDGHPLLHAAGKLVGQAVFHAL